MLFWIVKYGNVHVLVRGVNREDAKRSAQVIIGADPDTYTVTPITSNPGDRFWINISVDA